MDSVFLMKMMVFSSLLYIFVGIWLVMIVKSCWRFSCSLFMPYSGWFSSSWYSSLSVCQSVVYLSCLCISFCNMSDNGGWCLSPLDRCTTFRWWHLSELYKSLVGRWPVYSLLAALTLFLSFYISIVFPVVIQSCSCWFLIKCSSCFAILICRALKFLSQ